MNSYQKSFKFNFIQLVDQLENIVQFSLETAGQDFGCGEKSWVEKMHAIGRWFRSHRSDSRRNETEFWIYTIFYLWEVDFW